MRWSSRLMSILTLFMAGVVCLGAHAQVQDAANVFTQGLGQVKSLTKRDEFKSEYAELRVYTDAKQGYVVSNSNTVVVAGPVYAATYSFPDNSNNPLAVYSALANYYKGLGYSEVTTCKTVDKCSPDLFAQRLAQSRDDGMLNSKLKYNYDNQYSHFKDGAGAFGVFKRVPAAGVVEYVTLALYEDSGYKERSWQNVILMMANRSGEVPKMAVETFKPQIATSQQIEDGIKAEGKVSLYGILFDFDKDVVKTESAPALREIATYLNKFPQTNVLVVGHTDNQGKLEYNFDLSMRRALAVKAVLANSYGIAPARLTAFGAGMAAPVASNKTAAGQARNRRVELVER